MRNLALIMKNEINTKIKLTMDERRVPTIMKNNSKKRKKKCFCKEFTFMPLWIVYGDNNIYFNK